MRRSFLRPFVATATLALAAACSDGGTAPVPLDPAGLQGDLASAVSASSAPATESFSAIGWAIGDVLGDNMPAVVAWPATLLKDPTAQKLDGAAMRLARQATGTEPATIPAQALGVTFEYDAALDRYVAGERAGAPANGVRFVLYAVDPVTETIVEPLVETGYAEITRTVTDNRATARVQVFSGVANVTKVLDYAATVRGTLTVPELSVTGFARNASDSLAFALGSEVDLALERLSINWRAAVPSRGLVTRLEQSIGGGENPTISINSVIASRNGRVGLSGAIGLMGTGTLTVKVNGDTFATITMNGIEGEPTIAGAGGQPLTPEEEAMLEQIFDWFGDAFTWFSALLAPVGPLLDAAI